jgi:hypothetical protein
MRSSGARIVLVAGIVWVGQGAGFIPGSFMTGDRTWLAIGIVVGVVGIVLLASAARRPKRPQR